MIPTLLAGAAALTSFAVGWFAGSAFIDWREAKSRNDARRYLAMVGAMRRMSGSDHG